MTNPNMITYCPNCEHPMITLHSGHYHCDNCGGQISEEDL
jgi:hypothetical protein